MLALRQESSHKPKKYHVNILPCRVHRNGPSKVSKRLWAPITEKDGNTTVYFRGRKLQGRQVKLPMGYNGVVVSKTEQVLPVASEESQSIKPPPLEDEEMGKEEDEPLEPVKILREEARFDEIMVWGHDRMPSAEDNFVKGIEEWMSFAEAIHSRPKRDISSSTASSR